MVTDWISIWIFRPVCISSGKLWLPCQGCLCQATIHHNQLIIICREHSVNIKNTVWPALLWQDTFPTQAAHVGQKALPDIVLSWPGGDRSWQELTGGLPVCLDDWLTPVLPASICPGDTLWWMASKHFQAKIVQRSPGLSSAKLEGLAE